MDIDTTVGVLNGLAAGVRKRRGLTPEPAGRESVAGESGGPEGSGRPRATASA